MFTTPGSFVKSQCEHKNDCKANNKKKFYGQDQVIQTTGVKATYSSAQTLNSQVGNPQLYVQTHTHTHIYRNYNF